MDNYNILDDLYKPITQNVIDFWAKQFQTYYEFYLGENDLEVAPDNSVEVDSFVMSGCAFLSIRNQNNLYGGDNNGFGLLSTYFSFYPDYKSNPVLSQEIIAYTDNSNNYGSMADWAEARPLSVNMPYSIYQKNPFYPNVIYSPQASAIWTSITSHWNRYPDTYDSGSFNFFGAPVRISFDEDNQFSVDNQNMPILAPRGGAPYSVCWGAIDLDKSSVYSNQPIVSFSPTYMNYYQYETANGDVITTYYTDNSIINDSMSIPLSYNDYRDYMNAILALIKDNYDTVDDSVIVPTWDELQYVDMGDFYIEPLHQYGNLPTAPTFETSLDLSTYPSTIGSVASRYIDFLPLSISALLAGTVIVSAIVSFIRRDV